MMIASWSEGRRWLFVFAVASCCLILSKSVLVRFCNASSVVLHEGSNGRGSEEVMKGIINDDGRKDREDIESARSLLIELESVVRDLMERPCKAGDDKSKSNYRYEDANVTSSAREAVRRSELFREDLSRRISNSENIPSSSSSSSSSSWWMSRMLNAGNENKVVKENKDNSDRLRERLRKCSEGRRRCVENAGVLRNATKKMRMNFEGCLEGRGVCNDRVKELQDSRNTARNNFRRCQEREGQCLFELEQCGLSNTDEFPASRPSFMPSSVPSDSSLVPTHTSNTTPPPTTIWEKRDPDCSRDRDVVVNVTADDADTFCGSELLENAAYFLTGDVTCGGPADQGSATTRPNGPILSSGVCLDCSGHHIIRATGAGDSSDSSATDANTRGLFVPETTTNAVLRNCVANNFDVGFEARGNFTLHEGYIKVLSTNGHHDDGGAPSSVTVQVDGSLHSMGANLTMAAGNFVQSDGNNLFVTDSIEIIATGNFYIAGSIEVPYGDISFVVDDGGGGGDTEDGGNGIIIGGLDPVQIVETDGNIVIHAPGDSIRINHTDVSVGTVSIIHESTTDNNNSSNVTVVLSEETPGND